MSQSSEEVQENFNKRGKRSIWYWIGGILLIIILGIGGYAWHLSTQLRPMLIKRIKETITSSSDSLYTIDFADMEVNLVTGNISFSKIIFQPDSLVYERMKREKTAPRHLYKVELEGLILNRVNPRKVYFDRELTMDALIISNPKIQVFFEDVAVTDTVEHESKTIYQHISKYLKSIHINNIVLNDVDFKYVDRSLAVPEITPIKNVSVRIRDLLIDSVSWHDKNRFYYTKDVFVQVKDHKMRTKDGMYDVGFTELTASTENHYVNLKGFKLAPLYPDLTFSRKYRTQHDRYDLFFDEILLNQIDFKSLNSRRRLKASSLVVNGSRVNVFLNRELPKPNIDKGRNYPHLALKRLKLNTIIDTIKIQDAVIRYTEYNPKTNGRGTIFFRNVKGTIMNVTNDSAALVHNHWSRADMSAMLMGSGLLKVRINFNLTESNAAFNYSGSLGAMNARDFNQVLRPLGMVEIKSGKISKALFSVSANYRTSSGKLQLYYNDLKIGVLEKDDESTKLKKKGLISLIANALLITDDNPSPREDLRVGYISMTRTDQASFFNLMWTSIFDGLKMSIGFTREREKELSKSFDKMKGSPDINRKEKREERRQKREERRENNK